MKIKKLKKCIDDGKTALGIGPMSQNVIDATIEIADKYDIPLILIASRRQIDDKKIKAGYVNNWDTDEFVKYVNSKQQKNNIILARDHGGPWQNNIEIQNKLTLKEAMQSAKDSYEKDIDCGFDFVHIDPSIDIYNQISFNIVFERLAELYDFCSCYAKKRNKKIEFEVGTEEQMIHLNSQIEFETTINRINKFCKDNNLKHPFFNVTQIGTKVMEMKNIGLLNQKNNIKLKEKIEILSKICMENNFYTKVHNVDYLKESILRDFPKLKINAANVAPEFGVCETKALISILEEYNLFSHANDILELAYKSNKWEKWITLGSQINNRDKAIIAGHYIFSYNEFKKIKENAQKQIKDINIDTYLTEKIKDRILDYTLYFNLIESKQENKCTL